MVVSLVIFYEVVGDNEKLASGYKIEIAEIDNDSTVKSHRKIVEDGKREVAIIGVLTDEEIIVNCMKVSVDRKMVDRVDIICI